MTWQDHIALVYLLCIYMVFPTYIGYSSTIIIDDELRLTTFLISGGMFVFFYLVGAALNWFWK